MRSPSAKSLMASHTGSPRRRRHNRVPTHRMSSFRPRVEGLEERTMLSAMSVVDTDDSGPGSLRQAILDANDQAGEDTIQFASELTGTVGLTSGQLSITDDLTIDGPGADRLTISGTGASRVFHVGGATVAIDDLTIADGMVPTLFPTTPTWVSLPRAVDCSTWVAM